MITVIPGFVHTKMTDSLNLPNMLSVDPRTVGNAIFRAHVKKNNVIYIGWYWYIIMMIIKLIPERVFKSKQL